MKKLLARILFCMLLLQGGCQFTEQRVNIPEPIDQLVVVNENAEHIQKDGGKEYTMLSENFDIVVYPAKIIVDVIDELQYHSIVYDFKVSNKTQNTFENFQAILRLDASMEKFIQSGTTAFLPQALTLVPKEVAEEKRQDVWGIQVQNRSVLFSQEQFEEFKLSQADMFPIARKMQIQLEWDGGSEYYEFEVEVIDETMEN